VAIDEFKEWVTGLVCDCAIGVLFRADESCGGCKHGFDGWMRSESGDECITPSCFGFGMEFEDIGEGEWAMIAEILKCDKCGLNIGTEVGDDFKDDVLREVDVNVLMEFIGEIDDSSDDDACVLCNSVELLKHIECYSDIIWLMSDSEKGDSWTMCESDGVFDESGSIIEELCSGDIIEELVAEVGESVSSVLMGNVPLIIGE